MFLQGADNESITKKGLLFYVPGKKIIHQRPEAGRPCHLSGPSRPWCRLIDVVVVDFDVDVVVVVGLQQEGEAGACRPGRGCILPLGQQEVGPRDGCRPWAACSSLGVGMSPVGGG